MNISKIAKLNAYGPYEHGIWNFNPELANTNFESKQYLFFERSLELYRTLESFFEKNFSQAELTELSVLDIGCYDGWIITKLSKKFGFRRAVGIEPRKKNISKGRFARDYYEIESDVEFIQSDIDDAGSVVGIEQFDVVICLGTLHHVVSTPLAVHKLKALTRRYLVIDTMVIPSLVRDSRLVLDKLNLKDIAYRNRKNIWGIAGYKFESPYFDGSTAKDRIVSIPDANLLEMVFEDLNLEIIDDFNPEKASYASHKQKLRGVLEKTYLLRINENMNSGTSESDSAEAYESIFLFTKTDAKILTWWLKSLKNQSENFTLELEWLHQIQSKPTYKRETLRSFIKFQYSRKPASKFWQRIIKSLSVSQDELEILLNISRSPIDKLRFELLKLSMSSGENIEDKQLVLFSRIFESPHSDWRTFYRSLYFATTFTELGAISGRDELEQLLIESNPEFPLEKIRISSRNFIGISDK